MRSWRWTPISRRHTADAEPTPGVHRLDLRTTRSTTCSPASTSCVTRPRWSATGSTPRTCPTTPTTTTTDGPTARRDGPRRRRATSCWRRRWWSTATVGTPVPSTATCRRRCAGVDDLDAGRFDPRCPALRRRDHVAAHRRGHPVPPAHQLRRSKVAQEHYASRWCTLEGGRAIALRYHNVYGPGMPADTPYAGVAAIFRSAIARGEAPQVFEDGGQMRDFVHVHDVALANVLAIEQVRDHDKGLTPYNVASGPAVHPRRDGRDAGPGRWRAAGRHRRVPRVRRAPRGRVTGRRRRRAGVQRTHPRPRTDWPGWPRTRSGPADGGQADLEAAAVVEVAHTDRAVLRARRGHGRW